MLEYNMFHQDCDRGVHAVLPYDVTWTAPNMPQSYNHANWYATRVMNFSAEPPMLTAVVESQGSRGGVPPVVAGACLASSQEGDHQGSLGEACQAASAQQTH